ncbi:hypothetical protein EPI10_030944 [Gossypium australe]|uniref:Uncharacterized protein n=1 Tax=Gossypium australe TaxID=47621 RepID=A0A5B6WYN8_9ROSI|nr:hypothetical protein EPI10_030944 [Gossypium australe]
MKVLNETYVTKDISVNKLDRLVSNISADNFIYFSDDEIPPGGMGSTKALHITTRCKGYTLPSVLIDNGSALNVLPLATLKRFPIDNSHMKACQNIVRAFDDTERRVMGRIDVPLLIRPNTYEVDFLVMDIKPSYNCLLGRPWIHSAGAVPSSLHQKLKLVAENRLVTINAEEDVIATVTSEAPYLETNEEAIESIQDHQDGITNDDGKRSTTRKRIGQISPRENLDPDAEGEKRPLWSGFKPEAKQIKKEMEKKQERRRARLNGEDVKWEPMTFPHISHTFISGGIIYPGRGSPRDKYPYINAIHDEVTNQGNLSGVCPYEPRSTIDNWTTEEFPVVFRDDTESLDINDMSNDTTDSEVCFKQDMCSEESKDFENDTECDLPPDLLRMVEQEEKQNLPHKESVEMVNLGEGQEVKIGARITAKTRRNLIELLHEFKDVFAWSYQDMPGLSTDIAVHRLPIREECKPVQQKL